MENILVFLKNKEHGFERLSKKKLTAQFRIYGKTMKNQDISDQLKRLEELKRHEELKSNSKVL